MANPRPRNFQADAVREYHDCLAVALPHMLGNVIAQTTGELTPLVETLGKALRQNKMPRSRMAATNVKIAEAAQQAIVKGWKSRLPAHTPPYGRKRLYGHLGPALADPYMTAYTTDRIVSFINTEMLDREAPHWYRVNYGATGSRYPEGRAPERFAITHNGSTVASYSDAQRPDPKSWIPRKVMENGKRVWKAVPSPYGARAARFFELGHRVVARKGPQMYQDVWAQYLREQTDAGMRRLQGHDIHFTGDLRFQRDSWASKVRRS